MTAKASKKVVQPTTVKKAVKKSKTVAKASKKISVNKPVITEEMHEAWLFKLPSKYFVQLQKEWNERNLKIKLQNHDNYDDWFNYFKTLSPNVIKLLARTGLDILPTEAYSALARWHDIIANPGRIDKVHQSGLTNPSKIKGAKTIFELAQQNDRLGVLKATRDKIAEKLEKGAGARDTAALARELTEVMTQISDYEKRLGPKKDTELGRLIADMNGPKPRNKKSGARNTSYRSRVTIEDIER